MLSACFRRAAALARGVLGPLQTNCYLMNLGTHSLIVDPSADAKEVVHWIKENAPNTKTDIFLTHGHFDHIGAVPDLAKIYPDARIFASPLDKELFTDPAVNLSAQMGRPVDLCDLLDRITWVSEGDNLEYGGDKLEILHVPGHTPGSLALIHRRENCVIVGDTLFEGSVGNTQLPLGNFKVMMKSILDKLLKLPDEMIVLPGHGGPTTIGEEKKSNPFVLAELTRANNK